MTKYVRETGLSYFQQQALIDKITRNFAALNGYEIKSETVVVDSTHPKIVMWIKMAKVAIDEIEAEMIKLSKG